MLKSLLKLEFKRLGVGGRMGQEITLMRISVRDQELLRLIQAEQQQVFLSMN